jgi:hypothetical protein
MIQLVHLVGGEELEDSQALGVARFGALGGRIRGELAERLQGGDGGHEEGLVARSFHAAGGRFDGLVVRARLLCFRKLWLLRAEPALHRLAENGRALRLAERRALPGGGACPALFELPEVPGNDERLGSQLFGYFGVWMTQKVQTFDFGKERVFVHWRRDFFFDFFVHVLLMLSRGFRRFSGLNTGRSRVGRQ